MGPSNYDVALFLHLVGVLVFVAGFVVAGVAFEAACRRERPGEVALLLGLARVAIVLVGAGALVLLAFGLWLVSITGVGYGAGWVGGAIVLYVVALVLGGIGGQRPKRARRLARELADAGASASDELRGLLRDPASRVINYAAAAAVLAILALMVFKP